MLQLPNALTILRILLVPVFAITFVLPGEASRLTSFVIFCIAGASDVLDGLAARKLRARSELGRMLDPIADKILVAIALMMLVWSQVVSPSSAMNCRICCTAIRTRSAYSNSRSCSASFWLKSCRITSRRR